MSLMLEAPSSVPASAAKKQADVCQHCGTPLAAGQNEFCCTGCQVVHQLIRQTGLGRYYSLRPEIIAPVSPTALQPADFSWLQREQLAAEAHPVAGLAELSCQLQSLSCVACVWLVEQIFLRHSGAVRAEVDAPHGRVRLAWQPGQLELAAFAHELHRFGYQIGPTDGPALPGSRALAGRLGVCACLALNNMLFTLPSYLGMARDNEWSGLFRAITAICATLSLLAGGSYFMTRAWRGLRLRVLDLDLPIALGVTGAYLGSLAGWLLGRPELVYFDFVSLFIFLMLVGRWTQETAVERNRHYLLHLNPVPDFLRHADAGGANIPLERIAPGDRFRLGPGQLVPVAARLLVHDADFNLAWISGESAPRHLPAGRLVPAGAINAGQDDIVLEARENWSDSLLARLLRACRESAPRATGFERPMQFYFAAVFALATLGGIYWLTVGQPITAARAVLSLLVVSCPCVIGLSLPMAHELAVASLRRSGVFVRETHLWSRLARVRTLVFDKTGTLTFEHPVLQNPDALSRLLPATRQLLFHLVENSLHPFSRALREALLQFPDAVLPLPNAPQPTEVSGAGLWIRVNDATWSLGRAGWIVGVETSTQSATGGEPRAEVELRREGLVVAALHITERARPGTAEELAALARDGFAIHILSGDQPTKVSAFARSIGLAPERAHGGLTPEAKAAWVDAHHPENILILGDGANDALAFGRAAVRGTPVADRTVLGSAADFFLTSQNLSGVRELFAVARRRRRAARTAGTFALTYNIAAASVSLAGIMNPLLAAVLMPLSAVISLALVGAAFRAPTKSSSSLKAA